MFGPRMNNSCDFHCWQGAAGDVCPLCVNTRSQPGETVEVTQEELEEWNKKMTQNALEKQVDGNHYKDLPIQPIEYIHANAMGYMEGNVVKYISRWRKKNGMADLEKAKHYIELLIELENRRARKTD
ncbi:nucelotide kinase [Phage DSL-LC05]|nr:nucelotide kinase [Phage DSL-LC05]